MNYKEVFQLAQEKGYQYCDRFLNDNGFRMPEWETEEVQLLELTLIQKWLRDEHEVYVIPTPYNGCSIFGRRFDTEIKWVAVWYEEEGEQKEKFPTYEDAVLQGCYEALKLIP